MRSMHINNTVHGGGFAGTIQAFVKDEFVETYKKEIEKYFGEGTCHLIFILHTFLLII